MDAKFCHYSKGALGMPSYLPDTLAEMHLLSVVCSCLSVLVREV